MDHCRQISSVDPLSWIYVRLIHQTYDIYAFARTWIHDLDTDLNVFGNCRRFVFKNDGDIPW